MQFRQVSSPTYRFAPVTRISETSTCDRDPRTRKNKSATGRVTMNRTKHIMEVEVVVTEKAMDPQMLFTTGTSGTIIKQIQFDHCSHTGLSLRESRPIATGV